jgi:hypothetical protein
MKPRPSPLSLIAVAVAIKISAASITSVAGTVPALTLSAVKAALVEAWTIPAIHVKANRDLLDLSSRFDRHIGTHRRAQWQRLDTARHESACRHDGRSRSNS